MSTTKQVTSTIDRLNRAASDLGLAAPFRGKLFLSGVASLRPVLNITTLSEFNDLASAMEQLAEKLARIPAESVVVDPNQGTLEGV